MAHALAIESQPLALELYSLLRELDPVRWRDDLAEQASVRLRAIADAMHDLADRFEDCEEVSHPGGQGPVELWQRICALADDLDDLVPAPNLPGVRERRRAWMAVRRATVPRYELLVQALRAEHVDLPSIRSTNYVRNFFHVLGGLVAFAVIQLLPAGWLFPVAASLAAMGWGMEGGRRVSPAVNRLLMGVFRPVAHASEEHGVNSTTWYVTALALIALLGEPAACSAAVIVLATADPLAAIFGRRFGTIKLVNGRSAQGSLAFFVTGMLAALAVLTAWYPELSRPVVVAFAAALPATFAELFSRRLDDNFTIPVSAAVGSWLALSLVG